MGPIWILHNGSLVNLIDLENKKNLCHVVGDQLGFSEWVDVSLAFAPVIGEILVMCCGGRHVFSAMLPVQRSYGLANR